MRIANRNFAPTLFAVAITIAAVVVFARLAFWQLDRAAEKDALQAQYAAGQRSVVELTAANVATLTQYQRVTARGHYERALRCDPAHVEAHLNLAAILEEAERLEAALAHYKAALRADPMHTDAHLATALLYEKLGLRRRARDHWRRYLQWSPAGAWAEVARKRVEEGDSAG